MGSKTTCISTLDSQTYVFHISGLGHPIMLIYLIEYYIPRGGTYPHQVLAANWHLCCTFKRLFGQQQLGGAVFDRTSVFHDHVPTVTPPWFKEASLIQKNVRILCSWAKYSQVIVLAELLQAGNRNPYLDYIMILGISGTASSRVKGVLWKEVNPTLKHIEPFFSLPLPGHSPPLVDIGVR